MPTASCPSCGRSFRIAETSLGKQARCPGCSSLVTVATDASGALALRLLEARPPAAVAPAAAPAESPPAPADTPATSTCSQCGATVRDEDSFCTACGHARQPQPQAPALRRVRRRQAEERRTKVVKAARTMLYLGLAFLVIGVFLTVKTAGDAREARDHLATLDASEVVELEGGRENTVAELREEVDAEAPRIAVVHAILAATMFGLFFWAQRAPFAAIVVALCVYLVMTVLNGIINPTTLIKGWLWKIVIIGGFIAGIKAALAERALAAGSGAASAVHVATRRRGSRRSSA
jgi:DNA-directed RNA polymerase subunit RPC12/RpoP